MSTKGKLIVLATFVRNDEGELVPAFDPRQVHTEERAPIVIFQAGEVPGLD